MKKLRLPRPSAAMIVAVIALVVACAGSATAASLITGKQIKNRTVSGLDIKKRTLTSTNLTSATLKSLRGKAGPAGKAGTNGTSGTNGTNGKDGLNAFGSLVYKESAIKTVADGSFDQQVATCDAGMHPVGGGHVTANSDPDMVLNQSRPSTANGAQKGSDGWTVQMANPNDAGDQSADFQTYVICASAASVTGP
jgi:hypothetical protein